MRTATRYISGKIIQMATSYHQPEQGSSQLPLGLGDFLVNSDRKPIGGSKISSSNGLGANKVVPRWSESRSVGANKYYFTRVDEWGLYL